MTVPTDIVVLGAGRGSAELIDLLHGSALRPLAVLDDRWPEGAAEVLDVAVTGTLAEASRYVQQGRLLLNGMGSARHRSIRYDIHERLGLPDAAWAVFADPASTVSPRARLGAGTILYPGVRVAAGVEVGRQALVYYNSVIHHDSVLGVGVTICAGVLLAGGVRVGDGSYLGVGCVVRDGVTLGQRVLVGMGAVVTRDVPDDATVVGVPGKLVQRPEPARS